MLALSMSAVPAFAQSDELEWTPMDITAKVIDVERVHGTLLDEWTFTVEVTNNEAYTVPVAPQLAVLADGEWMSNCPPVPAYLTLTDLRPSRSATLSFCVVGYYDMEPVLIGIDGWLDPDNDYATSRHVVAFERGICNESPDEITCATQSITQLIRDVEPKPVQCEAPPQTPTMTGGMPNVGTAAYHEYFNDLIIAFDGQVELAEGWRDSMTIQAETPDGMVELEGFSRHTNNLVSPGNMLWLALAYGDHSQFEDATQITLRIDPGTLVYGEGRTNTGLVIVWPELIP